MTAPASSIIAPGRISAPGCHATPGWSGSLLGPVRPDYATAPIEAGFDWHRCLAGASGGPWYLVVFRSVRAHGADAGVLTEFDDRAHLEARDSGGLRLYFKGEPTPDRACLSLCLWDSAEQARQALGLPGHQAAVRIAGEMYERFALERHVVTRDPTDGSIRFSRA